MAAKLKFNESIAKLQHEIWKNKLLTFLNGGSTIPPITHRECALGKWLYEEGGMAEYGTLSELQRLEKFHANFHTKIKTIIDKQTDGDRDGAWEDYEALKPMSDELISIINLVGIKLK